MIINFLFINHPSKMLLSPQNLIFHKILKNRVYQIAKKPKKWKNVLFFIFEFHSKLVREHFGPKKMDPPICPPLGYFCNFNLNFEFLEKKYLRHPKITKIFFFCPNQYLSPAIWIFQLSSKTKKLQPFKVSLLSANLSKSRNFVAPVGPLRGQKKIIFLHFTFMTHMYKISDFQPNRWFCMSWVEPLDMKWPIHIAKLVRLRIFCLW